MTMLKSLKPVKLVRITSNWSCSRTIFTDISYNSLNVPLIPVRNRKFLAGSKSPLLPEYIINKPHNSLKILHTKESCLNTIGKAMRETINEHILRYPAILFKGMSIATGKDFDILNKNLQFQFRSYEAGIAYRDQISEYGYSASNEPPEISIEPNNELVYVEHSTPRYIVFCCLEAAENGGENPIVFNKDVMENLDKTVMQKVIDKQIRYIRFMAHEEKSDYLSWQRAFNTKSEKKAESIMLSEGMNWKWNENGNLNTWKNVSATRQHYITGKKIFANQVTACHATYFYEHPEFLDKQHLTPLQCPHHTTYGDGEELENDTVDHIRSVLWKCAVGLKLEPGDVLFIDNFLVMHSRMGYEGKRKYILSMIN